jgi:hypothetical protein
MSAFGADKDNRVATFGNSDGGLIYYCTACGRGLYDPTPEDRPRERKEQGCSEEEALRRRLLFHPECG